MQKEFQNPDFWNDHQKASASQKRASQLQEETDSFVALKKELTEVKEFFNAFGQDLSMEAQFSQKINSLAKKIEEKFLKASFKGLYDSKNAIIVIQAGAGGRDAEDWVCLLLKMYQKYAQNMGWDNKIISQNFTEAGGPEGRIGIKEVELEIKGKFVFGYLKKETGAHRLVRISPFSAKQLRHTSFARVEVIPKIEESEITENILNPSDLMVETFRSSGAGGQNVNRRETAVRITHVPTGLISSCQTERYQAVNKKIALAILAGKILRLKEKEKQENLADIRGNKVEADFGHQVRSYVLHPYNLVKDHRTNIETTNTQAVLNGELDLFIKTSIGHSEAEPKNPTAPAVVLRHQPKDLKEC